MVSCFDMEIWVDKSATGGVFSNYDVIKGAVLLKVHTITAFSTIQVKAEGISRTIMEIPSQKRDGDQPRPKRGGTETHRLLRDITTVLPSPSMRKHFYSKSISLNPGRYRFPFQFRLPLTNKCTGSASMPDKLPLDRPAEKRQYHIHVEKKLPPSFSELGNMALIRYFIKATAVRINRLKTAEMTAYEPIIFLPIDNYDLLMTDDKQAYTRREFVMKDKYPEIVGVYEQKARSPKPQQRRVPSPREGTSDRPSALIKAYSSEFLKSFFTTPGSRQPQQPKDPSVPKTSSYDSAISRHEDISSSDLSPSKLHVKPTTLRVVFEMRLRYPAFLIPSRLPNYQLYLLTRAPPEEFQLFNGQSSGLGFIYLRYLKMELVSITDCYVSSYKERVTKKKTIFEEDSLCYLLDLAYARRSKPYKAIGKKMYEITIPKKLYREAVIPDSVPPSFRTCNMERRYKLIVSAGFSDREEAKKGAIVTLETNVQVMSGIEPVMKDPDVGAYASRTELDRAMREAEFNTQRRESSAETTTTVEDGANGTVPMADDGLPTYDEVVKESTRRRVFAQDDFYYININD